MARRIEGRGSIEIYPTQGGQIAIKQDGDGYNIEDAIVILDVNDVPLVTQWLEEAATDAAEIRQTNISAVDEEQIEVHPEPPQIGPTGIV